MLAALLLVSLAPEPTVPLVVLADATRGQLLALDGQRRPFRIVPASAVDREGRWHVVEVEGPEGVEATAWLRQDPDGEAAVVWGRLVVIRHPARDGFEAFVEVRVIED